MRILFCGTAEFAVPSLRACNARHEVIAVVTQPEREGSRGKPAPRPVADAARSLGLHVLQPPKIRKPEVVAELCELKADVMVVAAYGQIIPESLLNCHKFGGVNVHGSLLPRWRGAAPVARAILAGDTETGVAIMKMEAGLDTGPVYATRSVAITGESTTMELTDELAVAGAEELVAVLAALEKGGIEAVPQPEHGVTYAERLGREEAKVDWSVHSAAEVDRKVRALWPWPGVVAAIAGLDVAITSGEAVSGASHLPPGSVAADGKDFCDVVAADGLFRIFTVKPPGKREMDAAAFLRGRRTQI